ncbi:hypothetical protein HDV05_007874, partial [Chytridiales sp. JEL 0842]
LARKVAGMEPLEVEVVKRPGTVNAEEPFELRCVLRNNSDSLVRVIVSGVKSRMSSVLLWGPADRYVGDVQVGGQVEFGLEFFPLLTGLHKVTGLKLSDSLSGMTRDLESLTDVYVI